MEYQFNAIEQKWQEQWKKTNAYKVPNVSDKPKYYVLDMFPYPSGAGLHVGHPLGYIASDIFSRYKRLKGYNVLHPMGYDAFGLPAEQYAIEHGVHPAISTAKNIGNFRSQLDKIGFCYDWDREVNTSKPEYYKWTQKIFLDLYNCYFCNTQKKARPIADLIAKYEAKGCDKFSAAQWNTFSAAEKEEWLMKRRLAFSAYGEVNWCEALGTVLANDEVVNGVSERGGHPVIKKKMRQWYLRITAYADRLLEGLERVDFSESMKEMQRNWIGRSEGAEIIFPLAPASPRRGEEPLAVPGLGYAKYSVDSTASFENAKQMRREPTEAEKILWDALRNRNLGYKFRRQHPIEQYIADFACLDVWLLVEVDGGYHGQFEQKEKDIARDNYLKQIGFTTLRFTNEEVLENIEKVLAKIKSTADQIKASSQSQPAASSSPLQGEAGVRVYTTRPDTIFGVDFMVIAPELDLVNQIKSEEQREAVDNYITYVKSRSDRERQAEVKQITGCFTGAYAINPFNGVEIPIYIAEYVLAGYGTGAIMAVPCGDERDFKFAQHFGIPITNIIGQHFNGKEANPTKDAVLENSGFLNGLLMKDAISVANDKIEEIGIGKRKVNYKMRDAGFSRQRYWGEPFPIVWKDEIAYPLDEKDLPLQLPHVEKYGPGPEGEGPLANIAGWEASPSGGGWVGALETSTMPGYAGSSWYFLRYMDPHNDAAFCDRSVSDYWNQVDLYVGGTEHAVGHLLYSRMWTKALYDLGHIGFDEPFKKLLNQGMIQGSSRFVYRINGTQTFVSKGLLDSEEQYKGQKTDKIHADVNFVDGYELNIEAFKKWRNGEYANAEFIFEDGSFSSPSGGGREGAYICGAEVEKMSKSKFNTVNPDDLVARYGADTFRMYEMFLGPVEISKPWDTKGIEGVHRFLKKLWRLYFDELKGLIITHDAPTPDELKVLHKTIKKIEDDTERFSFNTAVSAFMVCVNELSDLKCRKKDILEPLAIMLTPYAPHIAAELYQALGNQTSVLDATYPVFNASNVVESTKEYPVSINGKLRTTLQLPAEATQDEAQAAALANEVVIKWLEGKPVKKFIFVKGRMINVVI